MARGKFFDWWKRYGKVNEHNALVPRVHWLTAKERLSIVAFHELYPLEGYRRLTFMMIGRMWWLPVRRAGTGCWRRPACSIAERQVLPQGWRTSTSVAPSDLGSVLDGASRSIVHWEIRASMTEVDAECVLQGACERYPDEWPRIISDNGPQFIAKDFKDFYPHYRA